MSDRDKPEPPRCTARTKSGRPCNNRAERGSTRCSRHRFTVPGRPSKLTPELQERILDAVLEGNYLEVACQAVGVNKTTYYRWLRRADDVEAAALEQLADDDLENGASIYDIADPRDWPYLDFRHAIKSAEAFAETELLRQARAAGMGWQAFMAILERSRPARWRRRDTRELELTDAPPVRAENITPEDDRRRTVAGILAEAAAPHLTDNDEEDDGATGQGQGQEG